LQALNIYIIDDLRTFCYAFRRLLVDVFDI